MSGNRQGGLKAAKRNMELYGKDWYQKIGAIGGRNGSTGGFAAGEEGRARASAFGAIGGRISRRAITTERVKCPDCEREFKKTGLGQHRRIAHGSGGTK